MKLSITMAKEAGEMAPIVLRGSYTDNIKKAAKMGYDAVEIHVNDPYSLDTESILKTCEESGISVSTLGTGMGFVKDRLSFTDTDSFIRGKAVERINDHIAVAKKIGAMVIIGSMRGIIPDLNDYEKYEGYAIECTKKVMECAAKNEVVLVMEAINRYETNFINTVEEGMEFLNKVTSSPSPYIKLHLDTFHMNIEEADLCKSIEMAGAVLGHFHFADSNRWAPGCGHIDFKRVMNSLKKIKYSGYISFECLPLPTPDEASKKAIDYIKPFM